MNRVVFDVQLNPAAADRSDCGLLQLTDCADWMSSGRVLARIYSVRGSGVRRERRLVFILRIRRHGNWSGIRQLSRWPCCALWRGSDCRPPTARVSSTSPSRPELCEHPFNLLRCLPCWNQFALNSHLSHFCARSPKRV